MRYWFHHFTFFATVEALIHFGLKPVFVDIDRFNFTVDEQSFYDNVNKKKSLFASPYFWKRLLSQSILKYCKENNIKIVEDCAQSFGSKYTINFSTYGDIGAFSFFK